MTVVVRDNKTGELRSYTKGSFEKIASLAKHDSLPANYMHKAQAHAIDGCYVLGTTLCTRSVIAQTNQQEPSKPHRGTYISQVCARKRWLL